MGIAEIAKLFTGGAPEISTNHAERVANVEKRREELADRRQHLVWENERKLDAFDNGPGKELADYEAAILEWESKREETIARESLAAFRAAASAFGDQPRTATIAFRDAWRTYMARVRDELGSNEPNFLLLAAAFVDPECQDAIGSELFLKNDAVAGALGTAVLNLAAESVPRMTYALQHLDMAVDGQARASVAEGNADASRVIRTSAKHATVAKRVTLGNTLKMVLGTVFHRLANTSSAVTPPPPPKVIVQRPRELTPFAPSEEPPIPPMSAVDEEIATVFGE